MAHLQPALAGYPFEVVQRRQAVVVLRRGASRVKVLAAAIESATHPGRSPARGGAGGGVDEEARSMTSSDTSPRASTTSTADKAGKRCKGYKGGKPSEQVDFVACFGTDRADNELFSILNRAKAATAAAAAAARQRKTSIGKAAQLGAAGAAAGAAPGVRPSPSPASSSGSSGSKSRRSRRLGEGVGPFAPDLRVFTIYVGRQPSDAAYRLDAAAARSNLTALASISRG